jgi:hypothetical protein
MTVSYPGGFYVYLGSEIPIYGEGGGQIPVLWTPNPKVRCTWVALQAMLLVLMRSVPYPNSFLPASDRASRALVDNHGGLVVPAHTIK